MALTAGAASQKDSHFILLHQDRIPRLSDTVHFYKQNSVSKRKNAVPTNTRALILHLYSD